MVCLVCYPPVAPNIIINAVGFSVCITCLIDTKPTKLHENNVKQYKKVFEKWDMWDFAYFDGRDYYFLTQFEQVLKVIT